MTLASLRRSWQIALCIRRYHISALLPQLVWLDRLLWFVPRKSTDASHAERLKLALQELGPIFIKFGQMLSTRRDLLSDELSESLSLLQDRVSPFPVEQARAEIERSLGASLETFFDDFDPIPLASASVAQVHTAILKTECDDNGAEVVLKVVRPGIEKLIKADLHLMDQIAKLIAKTKTGKRLRPEAVVEDYRQTILAELDLSREANNAKIIRENFLNSEALYIPKIYPDLCHPNLMVMERIRGVPVTDLAALEAQGTNMALLAQRGVEVFFTQVFRDNFFHADMHPGNIFVSFEHPESPQYIGIDFGIVGYISERDKRDMAEIFLAFFNQDYGRLAQIFLHTGWVDADADPHAFEQALRHVLAPMEGRPIAEISFGRLLMDLFRTAHQFGMVVKPQLVLLEKTLLYIEGLGRQLYPQLDLWETAKPYLENWMNQQTHPKTQFKKLKVEAPLWLEKLPDLPDLIHDNLSLSRSLLRDPNRILNQYLQERRRQHKSTMYLIVGGVLVISSTILVDKTVTIWPSTILAGLGALAWIVSWQIRKP